MYNPITMRAFEVFLLENKITASDWQRLIQGVAEYEGSFTLEADFSTNNVEFYLYARKDFSLLAVKLQGFILKPVVREQEAFGNSHQYKRSGFRMSSSKNILEQREIEEIKKQRAIQKVVVNFRKILTVYFHSITVFLKDKNDRDFYSSYY